MTVVKAVDLIAESGSKKRIDATVLLRSKVVRLSNWGLGLSFSSIDIGLRISGGLYTRHWVVPGVRTGYRVVTGIRIWLPGCDCLYTLVNGL